MEKYSCKVKKIKIQLGYTVCDGQFYVSTGLTYSTQLLNQTPEAAVKVFCRWGQHLQLADSE